MEQTVRIEVLREFLAEEGRLQSADVIAIIHAASELFRREATVVTVAAPVTSLFQTLLIPLLPIAFSSPFSVGHTQSAVTSTDSTTTCCGCWRSVARQNAKTTSFSATTLTADASQSRCCCCSTRSRRCTPTASICSAGTTSAATWPSSSRSAPSVSPSTMPTSTRHSSSRSRRSHSLLSSTNSSFVSTVVSPLKSKLFVMFCFHAIPHLTH